MVLIFWFGFAYLVTATYGTYLVALNLSLGQTSIRIFHLLLCGHYSVTTYLDYSSHPIFPYVSPLHIRVSLLLSPDQIFLKIFFIQPPLFLYSTLGSSFFLKHLSIIFIPRPSHFYYLHMHFLLLWENGRLVSIGRHLENGHHYSMQWELQLNGLDTIRSY